MRVLKLVQNRGKGGAVRMGMLRARYSINSFVVRRDLRSSVVDPNPTPKDP
jgi:hypothetical protein